MSDYVTVSRQGGVAVVTMDNPPVNALSFHLREPLDKAMQELRDDDSVDAMVLICAGRTFIAGADITEFGKPMQQPNLQDLIATLESFEKPTIAAIHGTALGGGLELTFGCHFRVAVESAKVGLPEVKLGLLPGAGGTQRLPRVIGPERAVQMISSGNPIGARQAHEWGVIDALAGDDLLASAVDFANKVLAEKRPLVAIRDRDEKLVEARANLDAFDKIVAGIEKKARGLEAPVICARSVRNAITMPFEQALDAERDFFLKLVSGEQSRAQRHLFFAQREAAKVAGVSREDKPRKLARIGVIGAGTMGGGISMSFANGGYPITLLEMSQDALDAGLERISRTYDISVSRGSLTTDAKAERMARYTGTTDYADLADCDLIIEAVFEEIGVKEDVFRKLDEIAKPGAILASNTSYLDINTIAGFTNRPNDVLGMHFFSPANVMKLLEIVRGDATAPDVLATALDVGKRIGKVPVVSGVCHGFIGNRMLGARGAELEDLLLEGALPEQVDKVFTDFGWPMGPFAMGDLAGLDIGWRTRKALGTTAAIADAICEAGRFGQKTGSGFYRYEDGRTPIPDPWIAELIEEKAAEQGVNRRDITDEEITERTLYPMINEGAKVLEEGISARPSDIDIVWTNGYGFPIGKGGPMFFADSTGLKTIVERLNHWHGKTGNDVFKPAELLTRLANEDASFAKLQAGRFDRLTEFAAPWEDRYPPGLTAGMEIETYPVHDLVDQAAAQWPARPAIDFRGQKISYADLASAIDVAAVRFAALGVNPGDRIALLLPNTPWHPIAFFGALKAGATVVHASPLDSARVLTHKLADSGAKLLVTTNLGPLAERAVAFTETGFDGGLIVCDDALWGESEETGPLPQQDGMIVWRDLEGSQTASVDPAIDLQSLALLQYTGGTTGLPKAAMLTHENLSAAISSYECWYEGWKLLRDEPDRILLYLPLFHIYGLSTVLLRSLRTGNELWLRTRFDPHEALDDIEAGVTVFPGVPTMWIAIAAVPGFEQRDLSSLRIVASGGAPMPVEVATRFKLKTGLELVGGWGMSETAPAGTNLPFGWPDKAASIGIPLPGVYLRVVALDDPAKALGIGETGELAVRGKNVTRSYYNRDDENARAFVDGWFLTGDIGYMDEDGFFFIVDRKKDMIISGGFNVYPQMIEQAIYEHDDVEEVLVIGIADGYRGEAAKAFIKLRDGAAPMTLEQLRGFLKSRLGPHELPAQLEIRSSLPKTPVGKLSKLELKQQEAERTAAAKAS